MAMSDWGAAERAEGQRQDVRHTKWLARLFGRRSERPGGRIPTAGHGWAETVAAYRWLNTPDVGIQAMLSGQAPATLERIRAQAAVWLVQDTTCLTYGTTPPKAAMGPVKRNTREEYRLHSTGALTPERVHVGVVGRKGWQRPEEPLAQQRTSKSLAAHKRSRWLAGSQGACEVTQACPTTLVGTVAERHGELQEWGVDARRREPHHRAEGIIRAKGHRRLGPGAAPRS
jgi:hypothetical protein